MRSHLFLTSLFACALLIGCDEGSGGAGSSGGEGVAGVAGSEGVNGAGTEGGSGGSGGSGEISTIGAPEGELVSVTHQSVTEGLRENLTQHIDELDAALGMLEGSQLLENIGELLAEEDEERAEEEEGEGVGPEEEDFEVDLSEMRDGMIEVLTERILAESTLSVNEAGDQLIYQMDPEGLCRDDEGEGEELSPEELEERTREYEACVRRLEDHPVQVTVNAIGDRKINLALSVADHPDPLRVQIHDDLVAAFIPLSFVKRFIRVFVDEEDLEMPETMRGLIGLEARRTGDRHFTLRAAILEEIEVGSEESPAFHLNLASADDLGMISINGPENLIEGQLNLGTLDLELPWQNIVDMFYDDEGEMRTECFDNATDVAACDSVLSSGCLESCSVSDEPESCTMSCLDGAEGHVRDALMNYVSCVDSVPETECALDDQGCRAARCRDEGGFREVCEHQSWCEDHYEPAEEAPEVEGNLKVFIKAISGALRFDMDEHTMTLSEIGLGDETMTIKVEDAPIIAVDLNPENDRAFSLALSSTESGGLSLQVSPILDVRVALTLENVWEAFVEQPEDMPQVLANDLLGIKLDGSDAPTLELVKSGEEMEMRMSSGQLTLSSPHMAEATVIGEGMCIGGEDEESLSEEERESRHDLFGMLMSVECNL